MRIRDFALIRWLEIEFGEGLNLLTGETGSGKSILVDALGLLVGERASQEMVRSGCDQAVLEGVFGLGAQDDFAKILEGSGIRAEEDLLMVRREISTSGRSRIFINNNLATLSLLKHIGDRLVDIHGQHDHQSLLVISNHVRLLDHYGGNDEPVSDIRARYRRLQDISLRLDSMMMNEQDRLKKIDILQYQLDEIRRANLRIGERKDLENEKSILSNREKVFALATELYATLYEGDQSILTQANRSLRSLQELDAFDSRWSMYRDTLADTVYKLEDLAYFARDYTSEVDFSTERLETVEQRLSELDQVVRKYGNSVEEILQYASECEGKLQDLLLHKDRLKSLEDQLSVELEQYMSNAKRLSMKRRKVARQLEREIKNELQSLSLGDTVFDIRFHSEQETEQKRRVPSCCTEDGVDRVEFLVSTNKGEGVKPLGKVASGGELSRIILALKSVCGGDEPGKTLAFDEVDVGIGGRVAEVVGRRLRDISKDQQVLCVTHLAQIAAFGSHHYNVRKEVVRSRTETFVELLDDEQRIHELARMLGGETITRTTLKHAREMLSHSSSSV